MHFLTGLYAIQANAAALNNGEGSETMANVKAIRVQQHEYPYVSAQALRFWLRSTLSRYDSNWQASPIYRGKGKQQAYTAGDPISYWDDDLLGYMRAEKGLTLTRIAPFRTSTLVASAPVGIVEDFGVMARMEGNPVLHGHEFYRATLVGAFSLDLSAVGTFTTRDKVGHRNLSDEQIDMAEEYGLEYLPDEDVFRLPLAARLARIASLLRAFARLEGGAKQTLHYTDVSPAFVCMAVMVGGSNPFLNLIAPGAVPSLHGEALAEALAVYSDDLRSGVEVGLRQGFMDSAYEVLSRYGLQAAHPREAFENIIAALWDHPEWLA